VLALVEDRTRERRVESIRRDFVANVSHELKTPVGGLALLAEAVEGAADDPEAVERFAQRMRVEATRLTRLVQEIVDLSRLQVADTLHEPVIVDVAEVAAEAVERSRLVADAKGIEIATALDEGVHVFGDRELLITAVSNLVGNAIAYSGNDTKVAVAVHDADHGIVEVAVTDQGQGIPEDEQQRIFERFYRVDPARSRATGGTGLGLAIVKHVCANHGGEVTVWSEEGRGSTFTMRLPAAPESAADTHSSPNTEAAPAAPVTREVTR
jgi:two-component system sensor histidine kinase SenX3